MRTCVLILVIALLPLRMWAAEGMAMRMAQQQLAGIEMALVDEMPQDCPMAAQAMGKGGPEDGSAARAQCLSCHLCAAAACLPRMTSVQGPVPASPLQHRAIRYRSAVVAPGLRPPIS